MGLDTGSTQSLQRGDAIGCARCSSDADNQRREARMIPSLGTSATIFRDVLRRCTKQLRFGSTMSLDAD